MAENSKTRNRSPHHPAFDLETAIERAGVLRAKEHHGLTNKATAMEHWGYGPKSSAGLRTLAALLHFGLLEEQGSGEYRQVRLSASGRILTNANSPATERSKALREAALSPPIYQKLWAGWSDREGLPSDSHMTFELEENWGFNPKSIPGFIQDIKGTLEFAGLLEDDMLPDVPKDTGGADSGTPEGPRDLDTARQQEGGMPSTVQATDRTDWDLTIPLIGGGRAILRVPIPVTEADFDLLKGVITANLDAMKQAIVREPASSDNGA